MIARVLGGLRSLGGTSLLGRVAPFHASRRLGGLEEFFEGGQALPMVDLAARPVIGRAWSADELRLKSFDDLHRLWFVLLKELNLLATQQAEAARVGQRFLGQPRVKKVVGDDSGAVPFNPDHPLTCLLLHAAPL